MKKDLKIYIILLVLLIAKTAHGQTGTCPVDPAFSWEDPSSDNWVAKLGFGGNPTVTRRMGSPFSSVTGPIALIKLAGDYTKSEGWILLRKEFGCDNFTTRVPYFILYNQYRSIIRVFAYNDETFLKNGTTFRISHLDNSYSSGTLNFTKTIALSASDYPTSANNDLGIFKTEKLFPKWFYGEFPIAFDPNINNSNGIWQLEIDAVNTSHIEQEGTIHMTTDANDANLGVSSSKSEKCGTCSSLSDVNAKFGKLSQYLPSYDDLKGKVDTIAGKIPFSDTKAVKDLQSKLKAFDNTTIKNVLELNGLPGSVFSIASDLFSLFTGSAGTDNQGNSTFTPTVTHGTVSLSGTITESDNLLPVGLNIPGGNHPPVDDNNPYFEAPMGLFTLRTKPTLFTKPWKKPFTQTENSTPKFAEFCTDLMQENSSNFTKSTYQDFVSYQVQDDIEVLLNGANDDILELQTVEACLEGKLKNQRVLSLKDHFFPYTAKDYTFLDVETFSGGDFKTTCSYYQTTPGSVGYYAYDTTSWHVSPTLDFFQGMFKDQRYILESPVVDDSEPDNHDFYMIRTPFRNISCIKNTSLTLPVGSSVTGIKVRAIFKRKDGGAPVIAVVTFGVNNVSKPNDDLPYPVSTASTAPEVLNLGSTPIVSGGGYQAEQEIQSANSIQVQFAAFTAGKGITLEPGFDSNHSNFEASIVDLSCGQNQITKIASAKKFRLPPPQRRARPKAAQPVAAETNDFIAYPNPFNGSIKFKFSLKQDATVNIVLYNQLMQPSLVIKDYQAQAGEYELSREFNSLPAGIYFVNFKAGDYTVTRKIIKTEASN